MSNPKTPTKKIVSAGSEYLTAVRVEQYAIERARKDPAWFIWYLTDRRCADHHLRWLKALTDPKIQYNNIIAPRESAKTTIFVYFLAWYIGIKPYGTSFLGSVSFKQAADRLTMLKEIISLPRYKNVFPHIQIDYKKQNNLEEFTVWSTKWEDMFNPASKTYDYAGYRALIGTGKDGADLKNPTVFAAGIGSSKTIGRRFSGFVLLDDPHDEKNSVTEEARQKVEDYVNRTLLPCMKQESKIAVISTRWAETDLSGRLAEKLLWNTIDIPAIDADGNSYWPSFWPLEKLEAKRNAVDEVMFQLMYLNNPLGAASGLFRIEQLRTPLPSYDEMRDDIEKIYVCVDLASTTKTSSDYTVATAMGLGKRRDENGKPLLGNLYVLDVMRGKYTLNDTLTSLDAFCKKIFAEYYQLDGVLFEQQGFQSSWSQEFFRQFPDMPVKTVLLKGDKLTRLQAVHLKASKGLMYINTSMNEYKSLVSELLSFPRGQHDDIADSLSLLFQYTGSNVASTMESGVVYIKSPHLL